MKITSFPPTPLLSAPVVKLIAEYRSLGNTLIEARTARDALTDEGLDRAARQADVATLTAGIRKAPGTTPTLSTDGAVAQLRARRDAAQLHVEALDAAQHEVGNQIAATVAKIDPGALIADIDAAQAAVISAGDGLAEAVQKATTASAMLSWRNRVANNGPTDEVHGSWDEGSRDVALNLIQANRGDPSAAVSLGTLLSTLETQVAELRGRWS